MKRSISSNPKALAVAVALATCGATGSALAAVAFGNGDNSIFFQNFENVYRTADNCTALGGCLTHSATNDPVGWNRVDHTAVDNIQVGDVFAGVLNIQNIDSPVGTPVFEQDSTGADFEQFTGYFAQQVTAHLPAFDPFGTGVIGDVLQLGTVTVDPFGVLSLGEMFRLYEELGAGSTPFTVAGAGVTTFSSITAATNGTFYGSLGVGLTNPADGSGTFFDLDGYSYSVTDFTLSILDNLTVEAFFGLNYVLQGLFPNAAPINDPDENVLIVGGGPAFGSPSLLCGPLDFSFVTCSDVIGQSEIEFNNAFASTSNPSPWVFQSNDPFELITVPEPGTLSLIGLGLLGAAYRRRTQKA